MNLRFKLPPIKIEKYKFYAELFYQLFCMVYGSLHLTPYMLIYIDIVPILLDKLDFNLIRGSTEGSEKLNHLFNVLYYM